MPNSVNIYDFFVLTVRRSDTWRTIVPKKAAAVAKTSAVKY